MKDDKMIQGNLNISRPTFGTGKEVVSIQLKDDAATLRFIEIEVSLEDFTKCITGLSEIPVQFKVRHLERVGKVRECIQLEFPVDCEMYSSNRKELAIQQGKEYTPEGYTMDTYFGSQNSFFTRDDILMARTRAYRWVQPDQPEQPD